MHVSVGTIPGLGKAVVGPVLLALLGACRKLVAGLVARLVRHLPESCWLFFKALQGVHCHGLVHPGRALPSCPPVLQYLLHICKLVPAPAGNPIGS